MQVSIIPGDNTVVVNGVSAWVDCSDFAPYVRAVQWQATKGWIEFHSADGKVVPNTPITDFSAYLVYVDRWSVAHKQMQKRDLEAGIAEAEHMVKVYEQQARQKEDFEAAQKAAEQLNAAQRKEKAELNASVQKLIAEQADLKSRLEKAHSRIAVLEAKSG